MPNTNESATVAKSQKFSELNGALPEYIVYLDFDNNYHCSLRNFSENEMVVICPQTSVQLIVKHIWQSYGDKEN